MQRGRLVDQGRESVLSPRVRARVRGRRGRRGRRGTASAQLEGGCGVRVDVFLTVLACVVVIHCCRDYSGGLNEAELQGVL